jgi:hypothetical protein
MANARRLIGSDFVLLRDSGTRSPEPFRCNVNSVSTGASPGNRLKVRTVGRNGTQRLISYGEETGNVYLQLKT